MLGTTRGRGDAGVTIPDGPSTLKISGVGSRPANTKDKTSVSTKGSALKQIVKVIFDTYFDATTIRCLATLKCHVQVPRKTPEKASERVSTPCSPSSRRKVSASVICASTSASTVMIATYCLVSTWSSRSTPAAMAIRCIHCLWSTAIAR